MMHKEMINEIIFLRRFCAIASVKISLVKALDIFLPYIVKSSVLGCFILAIAILRVSHGRMTPKLAFTFYFI